MFSVTSTPTDPDSSESVGFQIIRHIPELELMGNSGILIPFLKWN